MDLRLRSICGALCAVLFVAGAHPAGAQGAVGAGTTVRGQVIDSATRVGVAGVEVSAGARQAVTDLGGFFALGDVEPGRDTLRLRRIGFRPVAHLARPAAEGAVPRYLIAVFPQQLSPVVVQAQRPRFTGRLAGYYERLERHSTGQFITRAEIDRDPGRLLSQLLRSAPGVRIDRSRGGAGSLVRMRGRNCSPLVWIDGVAMPAADIDIDTFSISSLQGIEMYFSATGTPGRFQSSQGRSECGTILLWSRGPDTDPVGRNYASRAREIERLVAAATVFGPTDVDSQATPLGGSILVDYPQELRATQVRGHVVAEFVVDTLGLLVPETYSVVSATHPEFAEAVRAGIASTDFHPALRNRRKVRQLVRQRFDFTPAQQEGGNRRPRKDG